MTCKGEYGYQLAVRAAQKIEDAVKFLTAQGLLGATPYVVSCDKGMGITLYRSKKGTKISLTDSSQSFGSLLGSLVVVDNPALLLTDRLTKISGMKMWDVRMNSRPWWIALEGHCLALDQLNKTAPVRGQNVKPKVPMAALRQS